MSLSVIWPACTAAQTVLQKAVFQLNKTLKCIMLIESFCKVMQCHSQLYLIKNRTIWYIKCFSCGLVCQIFHYPIFENFTQLSKAAWLILYAQLNSSPYSLPNKTPECHQWQICIFPFLNHFLAESPVSIAWNARRIEKSIDVIATILQNRKVAHKPGKWQFRAISRSNTPTVLNQLLNRSRSIYIVLVEQ